MIDKLIDKTKTDDLLFLSGIIINYMNEKNKLGKNVHSVLPELFSTMGVDNTINLIKYFGGETINIPSHEEMYQAFLIIICYYKKKIEGKDWSQIKEDIKIDISPHTLGKIIEKIDENINMQLKELRAFGIEEYIEKLKKSREDENA